MTRTLIFIACMGSAMPCYADPSTTTGHIGATVVEVTAIETPVEYVPVCKPDAISDDCIHSHEAMETEAARERIAAQLNNTTPAAGETK